MSEPMDLATRTAVLTKWQEHCLAVDAQWVAFAASTGATGDGPFGDAIWKMLDAYTHAIADLVGAKPSGVPEFTNDLSWYAYENDFGRKAAVVGVEGDECAIETPADLAWLIGLAYGEDRNG